MNIETGVFTTVTSGHYIVTYSASADVHAGGSIYMHLYQNGIKLEESKSHTGMEHPENGDNFIFEQASRTVVSVVLVFYFFSKLIVLPSQILHLLAGDTLDLRTKDIGNGVYDLTLCLYMAPAPYGLL